MAKMRTSKADYQYALEGVGYAQTILKNQANVVREAVEALRKPEVLSGETGEQYNKKLMESVEVINAVEAKYTAFVDKVKEICKQNGAQVDDAMMADFATAARAFAAKQDEIAAFKGQKR